MPVLLLGQLYFFLSEQKYLIVLMLIIYLPRSQSHTQKVWQNFCVFKCIYQTNILKNMKRYQYPKLYCLLDCLEVTYKNFNAIILCQTLICKGIEFMRLLIITIFNKSLLHKSYRNPNRQTMCQLSILINSSNY